MPPIRLLAIAACALLTAPLAARTSAPDRMLFRNNLLPGQLTEHLLVRTTQRTVRKPRHTETLVWQQQARLVQCNIDESTPGSVMLYQMIVDRPPRVLRLLQGEKQVTPTPDAAMFNLPQRSTRLHSATLTARDAPVHVPMSDRIHRTLLEALLDFAHWPVERIDAGHRWQRTLKLDDFSGSQTMEFVELVQEAGEVAARVNMTIKGKFTGKLERDYQFERGEAVIYWSRPDRTLLKMDGRIAYQRKREVGDEAHEMHLTAALTELRQLNDNEQELVKVQLTEFAGAMKEWQRGRQVEAVRRCKAFREKWPNSRWLPAVAQLETQASPDKGGSGKLSTRKLRELITRSIITWEAARNSGEHDLAEKTQKVFARLAEEYRDKLVEMSRDKDDAVRAGAAFALAFGTKPEDVDRVHRALRDKSTQVRSLALAGLAARRPENIKPKTLLALLDDTDAAVRRRACQAIAACIPPEHFSIVEVVEKIDHVMIHDDKDIVRREAIRTLAVIGAPADVPKLEQALKHELNQGIRAEIDLAIRALNDKE